MSQLRKDEKTDSEVREGTSAVLVSTETSEEKLNNTNDIRKRLRLRLTVCERVLLLILGLLILGVGSWWMWAMRPLNSEGEKVAVAEVMTTQPEQIRTPTIDSKPVEKLVTKPTVAVTQRITPIPYSITLPSQLEGKLDHGYFVSVFTAEDYINEQSEKNKVDPDWVAAQFAILREVSQLPNCVMTEKLKMVIENDFLLLADEPKTRHDIKSFYHSGMQACGVRTIGSSGYDPYLGNFEYQVAFLVKETVIVVHFPLFPIGVTPEVDQVWTDLRYDLNMPGSECDSTCVNLIEAYLEKDISDQDPGIREIVPLYDSAVQSLLVKL